MLACQLHRGLKSCRQARLSQRPWMHRQGVFLTQNKLTKITFLKYRFTFTHICVCVCVCFQLWAEIAHLYDVRFTHTTPHKLTCSTAVLLCYTSVVSYIMKWGNVDLFLALKSVCHNDATGLCIVSDRLTHAQAVDFKDTCLLFAGRCDGAVKRGWIITIPTWECL